MHGYFLGQQSLIICFVIDFKFQWSSKVSTSMFEFREHNTMCFLERRHSQSLGMEFSQMSSEPDIEAYCTVYLHISATIWMFVDKDVMVLRLRHIENKTICKFDNKILI